MSITHLRYLPLRCYGILTSSAKKHFLPGEGFLRKSISTTTIRFIDKKSIEQFQLDGAVPLRKVFDLYWIEQVASGIQKSLDTPSIYSDILKDEDGGGLFFNDYCKWESIPEFKNFVQNSICAEIAGKLMKSRKATFFHDHVFVKKGGTQRGTPWHQDQPYYSIDGFQTCSIWMPVTHVKKDVSLQFIKGSHLWSEKYIPRKFETTLEYEASKEGISRFTSLKNEALEKEEVLSWELEPGDCVAFHMQTLHGTSGATSPTTRRVLVTRWLGDDCVIADRPWTTSPPPELFNIELKPGTKVTETDAFPTFWTDEK